MEQRPTYRAGFALEITLGITAMMAIQREAGDFDREFSARLASHLLGGGHFDKAVVEIVFREVARHLQAVPSKRDAMDIEHLFSVISPIIEELRQKTERVAAKLHLHPNL